MNKDGAMGVIREQGELMEAVELTKEENKTVNEENNNKESK